jgi:serine/threonine-protein kinase
MQTTSEGQLKGKLAYMAPEQLLRRPVDHRADLFAAGVVLWEALTGERLFASDDPAAAVARVLACEVERPSTLADLPSAVDDFALRALSARPSDRFATAREMAVALHAALPPASTIEVGEWVTAVGGQTLRERTQRIAELESSWPEPLGFDPPEHDSPQIPELSPEHAPVRASLPTIPEGRAEPGPEADPAPRSRIQLSPLAAAVLALAVAVVAVVSYRLLTNTDAPAAAPTVAVVPTASTPVAVAPSVTSPAPIESAEVTSERPLAVPRTIPRKRSASQPLPTSAPKPGLAPLKEYE